MTEYSGRGWSGKRLFLQKKRGNFLTERLHCFDSFKSWVRVMVKWGNGFFWEFFGGTLIYRGKPKKNLQKKYLSLNCWNGHNFGPTECCKSLHRTSPDWMLVFIFFEKNNFPDFFKHQVGQFSPQNTPSVYWILSREICVVQHGLSVNHKPIGVCPPCWSQKNWQKIHFCVQKWSSKNPNSTPQTSLSLC